MFHCWLVTINARYNLYVVIPSIILKGVFKVFEVIQSALADMAEKLEPIMPYTIIPVLIYLAVVNSKLKYPMRGEPFWTDNVKQVTIQSGIGFAVLGAGIGFFLQSVYRSVYSLLLIPLSILGETMLGIFGYIFALYIITEGKKREKK